MSPAGTPRRRHRKVTAASHTLSHPIPPRRRSGVHHRAGVRGGEPHHPAGHAALLLHLLGLLALRRCVPMHLAFLLNFC